MGTLEEKKAKRFMYLNAMYEKTDGDKNEHVDMYELGEDIKFTKQLTEKVVDYLIDEGLLEYAALNGIISITHYGVVNIEDALSSPTTETHYFPPVVNVINVNTMIGSQVQQGSTGGSQNIITSTNDIENIRELINDLSMNLKRMKFNEEVESDIEAEIKTIESQLSASKPKSNIIKECFKTVKTILEGAVGNVVAAEFIQKWLPFIVGFIGSA